MSRKSNVSSPEPSRNGRLAPEFEEGKLNGRLDQSAEEGNLTEDLDFDPTKLVAETPPPTEGRDLFDPALSGLVPRLHDRSPCRQTMGHHQSREPSRPESSASMPIRSFDPEIRQRDVPRPPRTPASSGR
jgi:hypothetical protein